LIKFEVAAKKRRREAVVWIFHQFAYPRSYAKIVPGLPLPKQSQVIHMLPAGENRESW
jgi:hypothetical protein